MTYKCFTGALTGSDLTSLITKLVSCGYKILCDQCSVKKCSTSAILKSLEGG